MRPRAQLVSEYNYLSKNIYQQLLSAGCDVQLVSKDRQWSVMSGATVANVLDTTCTPSYLIVIHNDKPNKISQEIVHYIAKVNTKVVVVFAQGIDPNELNTYPIDALSSSAKTFVLPDVFGDGMDETSTSLQSLIVNSVKTKKINIPSDPKLYALHVHDVVAELIKELFTYWTPKFVYLANVYSWHDLARTLASQIPGLQIGINSNYKLPTINIEKPSRMTDTHFSSVVAAMVAKYKPVSAPAPMPVASINSANQTPTKGAPAKNTFRIKHISLKYLAWVVFVAIIIVLTPIASVAVSGVSLRQAVTLSKNGKLESVQPWVNISRVSAEYARGVSRYIPLYSGIYKLADLEISATKVLSDGVKLMSMSKTISSGLMGKSDYDISATSRDMGLVLSRLYYDISSIYVKAEFLPDIFSSWIDGYLTDLKTSRQYILSAQKFASELPEVLGATETKRYLVLLQNNMELRPTGGFIGSFALITFEHGKLIDTEVMDVYAADGQLQGYVAPPAPIRDYLGEASWHMRDSNWSPDFPTSAVRAEWFLDKTINRKVDGIIAINLETAKSILRAVGQVTLRDYGDTVDADNLYERVQHEVENDFFPGSKKKANYLTALASSLVDAVKNLSPRDYSSMSKELLDRLSARDIQIYMHNKTIEETTRELGWDGGIDPKTCAGNCESLELGFVEANVGVNKANYHVERESSITLSYSNNKLVGEMSMTIKNTAALDSSVPDNRYKNYLRVFAPSGAAFQKVGSTTPEVETLEDRVEAGLLVDINPGEEKTVLFKWIKDTGIDFTKPGQMSLHYWKQSGVNTNPTQVSFKFPDAGRVRSTPALSLTKDGSVGYNTELIGDFSANISWEGKK